MDGFASVAAALPQWFMVSLGVVSTILAFGFFVIVGEGYMTPSSVVFFAWGVFVGFPITFLALDDSLPLEAVQAAISSTCALLAFSLILPSARPGHLQVKVLTDFLLKYRKSIWTLSVATAASFIVTFDVPLIQILSNRGLIACAFAIFAVGVALISSRRRVAGGSSVLVALLLGGIWFREGFSGYGRINVAAVGLAFLCIWSCWFPRTWTKIAMVVTIPIGLTWAAMRREAGALVHEVWVEGVGLESVMAPLMTYGELIRHDIRYGFWAFLDQVVVSVFFWVPRAVWPSKPEGFGRLMVYELRPQLVHTNHSMAASWLGQGFAYLGPIGVLIMMVLTVVLVKVLDSLFWRGAACSTPRQLFYLIVGVWGGAQLLTFMWAGTFTFAARTGALLFGLGGLCIMIWLWRSTGLGGSGSQAPWNRRVHRSRRRQGLKPVHVREM